VKKLVGIKIPVALTDKTVVIKKCPFAFVEVPNLTLLFSAGIFGCLS
jgi:hypothetical protein